MLRTQGAMMQGIEFSAKAESIEMPDERMLPSSLTLLIEIGSENFFRDF